MAERDELLEHSYDGIQEYDNDLPRWWTALFILTVVYGLFYVVYYHLGPGLFAEQQLAVDMKALEKVRAQQVASSPEKSFGEDQLLALVENDQVLELGGKVFQQKCAACHGMQGQGLVGPNLTDAYWVHGGSMRDVLDIVVKGVPEKGMLAWKGVISDEEIRAVVAYIKSIQGTNPPNPKKPEGELVELSASGAS